MSIVIQKDVPVPVKSKGKKYPYDTMDVGDSFFVDSANLQVMCNLNYRAGKKHERKFIARKENDGIRVWREA